MATNNAANNASFGQIIFSNNQAAVFGQDGVYSNGNQPSFNATVSGEGVPNVTGDGTVYPIVFDQVMWNDGSEYDSGTGIWTPGLNFTYMVNYSVTLTGIDSSNLGMYLLFADVDSETNPNNLFQAFNPFNVSFNGGFSITNSLIFRTSATLGIKISIQVFGVALNVGISSPSLEPYNTYFSAYRLG